MAFADGTVQRQDHRDAASGQRLVVRERAHRLAEATRPCVRPALRRDVNDIRWLRAAKRGHHRALGAFGGDPRSLSQRSLNGDIGG